MFHVLYKNRILPDFLLMHYRTPHVFLLSKLDSNYSDAVKKIVYNSSYSLEHFAATYDEFKSTQNITDLEFFTYLANYPVDIFADKENACILLIKTLKAIFPNILVNTAYTIYQLNQKWLISTLSIYCSDKDQTLLKYVESKAIVNELYTLEEFSKLFEHTYNDRSISSDFARNTMHLFSTEYKLLLFLFGYFDVEEDLYATIKEWLFADVRQYIKEAAEVMALQLNEYQRLASLNYLEDSAVLENINQIDTLLTSKLNLIQDSAYQYVHQIIDLLKANADLSQLLSFIRDNTTAENYQAYFTLLNVGHDLRLNPYLFLWILKQENVYNSLSDMRI